MARARSVVLPFFALAVLVVAPGCTQGGSDGGTPDGGDGSDAPIDAVPARTDLVPAVGTAGTLDLATWNVRMFPSSAETPDLLADLVASMALDLVVLQEVDDARAFQAVDARLGGWATLLPSVPGGRSGSLAVIWREDTVAIGTPELLFLDDGDFPRPPVLLPVTVGGETFTLIIVHLKAGFGGTDEAQRVAASATLEARVRELVAGAGDDRIVVIGDWNTALEDSRADEVFAPWGDGGRYRFLTEALAQGGAVSFLPSDVELDHIVTTTAFDALRGGAQPEIPALDDQLTEYQVHISDHLPVVLSIPMP